MDEIRRELDTAWALLSGIAVRGEGVDLLAMARACLRRARELTDKGKKDGGGEA